MPNLIQQIAWLLTGGEPRLVLTRGKDSFVLSAYKGKKAANLGRFLDKWSALSSFIQPKDRDANTAEVPVPKLSTVRLGLQSISGLPLKIEIAPDVLALQPVALPNDFAISYEWSKEGLARRFSGQADYFGNGWFIGPGKYWQIPGLTAHDDEWLRLNRLLGEATVSFLQQIVPEWQKRKLPVRAAVQYSAEPAVHFEISNVSLETVQLSGEWIDNPGSIQPAPAVEGYVIAGGCMRPGIAPQQVETLGQSRQFTFMLKGEEVPLFVRDLLPKIRNWTSGDLKELDQMHGIANAPAQLIVTIHREETQGIGSAVATPEFVSEQLRVPAEEVSLRYAQSGQFIRVNSMWLPKTVGENVGIGPYGRTKNGHLLGSTTLAPAEVLLRGSRRLYGPWGRIEFPKIDYPSARGDFAAHFEFLLKWGVPGGAAGDTERAQTALRDCVGKLVSISPEARILLVAGKKTLDQIRGSWGELVSRYLSGLKNDPAYDGRAREVVFATPKALEEEAAILKTEWHLLILLEADALIKTSHSKFFENVSRITSRLVLGSFASVGFRDKNSQREALAQVFKIPAGRDGEIVWKFGLRALHEPCPALPPPMASSARSAPGTLHEVVWIGGAGTGIPIPQRPVESGNRVAHSQSGLRIQVNFVSPEQAFLEEARKLATYEAPSASHVPFQCYWPTYAPMTAEQKRWYFYWRGRVRAGQYPDTDLSYIFVHVYELINHIGCADAESGYRLLRALWLSYRERHPKLDNYLPDWIVDYIILNLHNVDPLLPYVDLLSFDSPVHEPDLLLTRYATGNGSLIPLSLLSYYSDYRLDRSKFYNATTQQIFSTALPEAFSYANKAFAATGKTSLLEHYRPQHTETIARSPFRSAVYPAPREEVALGIAYRYIQHAPFRELITSIFKYFENELRKKLKHGSLLRGMGLPSEVQTTLDSYLKKRLGHLSATPSPSVPRRRIEIDVARVQDLTAESDQVREMLITASGVQAANESAPIPHVFEPVGMVHIPRPEGTPDHLLTDLDVVFSILSRLEEGELHLLDALMATGWEAEDGQLKTSTGDLLIETAIGHINQLSLRVLGDLLVATEGTRRIVAEDFRDELEHLCVHYRAELRKPVVSKDTLPSEWIELRKHLSAVQLRVLAYVLERQDVQRRLAQVANECGSMPDTLLDGINDLAMDMIGDIILDTHCDPPAVEEEDRALIQQILALELSNAATQNS
jgi:hypothetical protein